MTRERRPLPSTCPACKADVEEITVPRARIFMATYTFRARKGEITLQPCGHRVFLDPERDVFDTLPGSW